MTANPLKSAQVVRDWKMSALDYYHRAVETGQRDKAALWWAEAVRLGEVNNDPKMRAAGE